MYHPCDALARREELLESCQLRDADRAEEIGKAVVEARRRHVAERRPAVMPEAPHGGVEPCLVGRDRAPLPGRDDLARVEREARRHPERAARRSAVARAERPGGVLDEHDLLRYGGLQRLPLDRSAEEMHRHDGARPRRHRRSDGGRVEDERVRFDVDEHRARSAQLHRVRRGRERVGRDDHLVARSDLERKEREMKRRGSRRDGGGVRGPDGLRDGRLELRRPWDPS